MKKGDLFSIFVSILVLVAMLFLSGSFITKHKNPENPNKDFKEYYYYESSKEDRYHTFKKDNPVVRNIDIVWMVNMNLDDDHYENPQIISNPHDPLVVVNKHFILSETFVPSELVEVGNNQKMVPQAAEELKKLIHDASEAGYEISPQSGYRSYKLQTTIYNENKDNDPNEVDTYSARPGFSEHQTGLAMDINLPYGGSLRNFVGTKEAQWVAENAYKYGFIVRYTEDNKSITGYMAEPWHIRYIGKEHASKMKEENIGSYEEYKVKFIDHQK